MSFKRLLALVVVFCSVINQTLGDDCVPSVLSVDIASNATLFWELDPSQSCEVTSYKVDVIGSLGDEYHFTVTDTSVDLSFMQICEKWYFVVTPISHDVIGYARSLTAHIPLPPDADLSLSYFNFTFSGRDIYLQWDLSNRTHGDCTLEYRMTLRDLETGITEDVYVEGKTAILDNVSPCMSYEADIRAINQAHPTIEGPIKRLNLNLAARAQLPPALKSIDIKTTSISLVWNLEGQRNRCPLRTFYVDGGRYFNTSVSLLSDQEATEVSIDINSLTPNSMYYMEAVVENSGGLSPATPLAVQTLELSPS